MVFKCYKPGCRAGVLDSKVAIALGITDSALLKSIDYYYQLQTGRVLDTVYNDVKVPNSYFSLEDEEYHIPEAVGEYYKKRTFSDIPTDRKLFKIVSCLGQFAKYIDIPLNKQWKYLLYAEAKLGERFIGFVNESNDLISIRNIKKKVFYKIGLTTLTKGRVSSPFKIINPETDMRCFVKRNVIIQEGMFDLINVYSEHFKETGEYYATTSFNATKKLIHNITKFNYNVDIHIFSDSDISLSKYKWMLRDIEGRINKSLGCGVTVYYNTRAKDFGDKRKKVSKTSVQLL